MKDLIKREFTIDEIINVALVSIMTIMPLITIKGLERPFMEGKLYFIYTMSITMFVLLILNIKKFNFKIEERLLTVLFLSLSISTIFSFDPLISLFGEDGWEQGLLMYGFYFIFFLMSTKFFKITEAKVNISCIFACVMGVHIILQYYGIDLILKYWFKIEKEVDAIGTIGNRNLASIFVVIFLCISTFALIVKWKKKYAVYTAILFAALLGTLTRGAWLGFGFAFFIGCLFVFKEKEYRKRIGIILLIFTSIFLLMNFTNNNKLLGRGKELVSDVKNVTEGSGSGRIKIWKASIKCIKENPVLGIGIDSLKNYSILNGITENSKYNKAHNEFLDYWLSGGIVGLIAYIALVGVILLKLFKIRESNIAKGLIVVIIGYLAQSFFMISIIETAPIYWIIVGSAVKYYRDYEKKIDLTI